MVVKKHYSDEPIPDPNFGFTSYVANYDFGSIPRGGQNLVG
jgi:hypothetical protein